MVQLIEISLLFCFTLMLWMGLRPTMRVKEKRELGVKRANPIYKDEKGAKLLVAEQLALQGKPDFVFETWLLRRYIPLEIKSGKLTEDQPHPGDVYQLVAYFLIIEEVYGKRPPYGKLVYANKTFTIRNTAKLRNNLRRTIKQMRQMLEGDYAPLATPDFMKCKHCICKDTVCEWQGDNNEKRRKSN